MSLLIQFIVILSFFTTAPEKEVGKEIPEAIAEEVNAALEFYPELEDVTIYFEFKKKIKHSTMQAQPLVRSIFKSRKNREYVIKISQKIKIEEEEFYTKDVPKEVLIGWIGHELGHIMDYQQHSNLGMLWFGIKYLLSDNYIAEAERAADTYAVQQGMTDFIIETKRFILNHAKISKEYKLRIKKYYLSPKEIIMLAENENVERIKESINE